MNSVPKASSSLKHQVLEESEGPVKKNQEPLGRPMERCVTNALGGLLLLRPRVGREQRRVLHFDGTDPKHELAPQRREHLRRGRDVRVQLRANGLESVPSSDLNLRMQWRLNGMKHRVKGQMLCIFAL